MLSHKSIPKPADESVFLSASKQHVIYEKNKKRVIVDSTTKGTASSSVVSGQNNKRPHEGDAHPDGIQDGNCTPSSSSPSKTLGPRQERLEEIKRRRAEQRKYDIVTVGTGRKTPNPLKPESLPTETDGVPLYGFQIHETFIYDVPNMLQPHVRFVKTLIDKNSNRQRKVVPLKMSSGGAIEEEKVRSCLRDTVAPRLPEDTPEYDGYRMEDMAIYTDRLRSPSQSVKRDGDNEDFLSQENEIDYGSNKKYDQDYDRLLGDNIRHATLINRPKLVASKDDPPVAPNDENDISKMRNAEDVISFFSQRGSRTAVKYVYLNRAETGLEFRPYDLDVVLWGKQQAEHFVVSNTGVVHVRPGQQSDVMSLSDWMRESGLFNVLRKIKFFRSYIIYKVFARWKSNIRLKLYCETRKRLCKRFFLSISTFAGPAMELSRRAYDLSAVKILQCSSVGKQDYGISEFNQVQSQQRSKALLEFIIILEKMETRLSKLTDTIQQRSNVPDLTSVESLEQYLLANEVAVGTGKCSARKSKSIVEAKEEQFEHMRELKRSMVEFQMLDSFIRLVDYMSSEVIFKNALLTMLNFYRTIRDQEEKEIKTVGFQILVIPTEGRMIFNPQKEEIVKVCLELVDETAVTVNNVNRILNQKASKVYFAKNPRFWNIGVEFKKDERIACMKHNLRGLIGNDYNLAAVKMRQYELTLPWILFIDQEWPELRDQWKQQKNNSDALPTSCEEFSNLYDKLDQANVSFRVLIPTFVRNLLYINVAKLKNELEPKIKVIKIEVDEQLTNTTRMRRKELQEYFTKKKVLLATPPIEKELNLYKFVDFIENLNQANLEKGGILDNGIEIDALYALMEKQDVELTDEDKQLRELTLGVPNQQTVANVRPLRDQFFQEVLEGAEFYRLRKMELAQQMLQDDIKGLCDKCDSFENALLGEEYSEASDAPEQVLEQIAFIETELKKVYESKELMTRCCKLLSSTPDWSALESVEVIFGLRKDIWTLVDTYNKKVDYWFETPLKELDVDEMDHCVKETYQKVFKLNATMQQKQFRDEACPRLIAEAKDMKDHMAVILDCGNKNMTSNHWNKVFAQISGGAHAYNEGITLTTLRDWDVFQYKDIVGEQSGIATGEANLVKAVDEIERIWEGINFETKKYKDDRDVTILATVDEIIQQLDDHTVQLQTIMASRYITAIRFRVEEWTADLRIVNEVIEEWITLQKNWMYLEFIFSSDDIKRQLPEESAKFNRVDSLFKDVMKTAEEEHNVLSICTQEGLLEDIKESNKAIDDIQKKLEDYLETKRVAFPRFYFLSNDELLSILSDVRNPRAVQPHLQKCFDNITALIFNNEEATDIGGMKSGEGEEVTFNRVVRPIGNVEQWLSQIEKTMKSSLLKHMRDAMEGYPDSLRTKWFFEFPAQCIQAIDMVVWTSEVEEAITDNLLPEYHKEYHQQIIETVQLVKTPLSKLQRTLVCTLIVVDVHNRDVVERLSKANSTLLTDFDWVMQLKYYWEHDDAVKGYNVGIHHMSAHLWYGYEYLGNQPRLVITPLTDRAFLTCTSALAMNLGAAPQGPAGTGKTESVKDLGKALARQVVVFNCSDGINYKTMSRMFAGLAQAGAWACFDEFNRIELEVLSVIAQQMLEIVMALGHKLEHMEFDGHPITLSKNFGVFITMNPGYAGRTELPDNLKALFRPICMMIPDYALIAEIMFYSEGFADARTLAQKMIQLYKLSSEQLSKQDHYDFGMRAVKSILVMAGSLKRTNPNESEDMLLIRAMRDSNVPKFLREDTVLFMALIKDLFPSIEIEENLNELLLRYLREDMDKHNLQVTDGFVIKVTQLFDTLVVRHGVMAVGQTYCAKTSIIESLQRTLTNIKADGHDLEGNVPLYNTVTTYVLNPKAVTMGELYGDVNAITKEWTDGILSNIARGITREYPDNLDRQWIIFDGPVDAIWIENMNTVLDDNKMLCLFSGERIKLPPTATFMFEVQDLVVASPATVSRCGMVFVEPFYLDGDRGWRPVAQSLSNEINQEVPTFKADRVMELLDKLAVQALKFIRTNCTESISTVDAQLAVSCLMLLKGFMLSLKEPWEEPPPPLEPGSPIVASERNESPTAEEGLEFLASVTLPEVVATDAEGGEVNSPTSGVISMSPVQELVREFVRPAINFAETKEDLNQLFDMYFICAFVWSFGGNLHGEHREKFNEFMLPVFKDMFSSYIPDDCVSVYDLCVHRPSMKYITWRHLVPDFFYDNRVSYFELFVPTAETTALKALMKTLLSVSRNVLVTGITGVGKSVVIQDFLVNTLKADNADSQWEYFYTAFSAQTNSRDVEEKIDSKMYKVKMNLLGSSPGKCAIFFIDDLNMPTLEKYGASPPIEFIRQILSQKGFYDRKRVPPAFKGVKGLSIISACGVPGGGRNEISKRLTSRFHVLYQDQVSGMSISRIFTSILAGFLYAFSDEVQTVTAQIIAVTKQCYDKIALEKKPTPDKSHYTFNLRDFGKVVQGLLQAQPRDITTREDIIKLYIHEVSRVFHDRLTNKEDTEWWWNTLSVAVKKEMHTEWLQEYRELIFGDFMSADRLSYKEVPSIQVFQEKLLEYQEGYNVEYNKETSLVFFADAAHHLSRICRICRQPRGHALLIGVGGSGRQSLTRLAAFICDLPIFQIAVTRSYTMTDFLDNIKEVLLAGGCDNPVVFLLSDTQIQNELMIEVINNVLNTGEVPNLMEAEDMDRILSSMRPLVQKLGKPETRNTMFAHFVQLCRDNVHIVLAMSPVGDSLRRRLRMFPSLVNCMSIDWYSEWPSDALISVARRVFVSLPVEEEIKDSLCQFCVFIHEEVKTLSIAFFEELRRHNYTTPTSYLELLNSYSSMLAEQNSSVNKQIQRLQGGLDKLYSTQIMVDEMKVALIKMQPVLEESARKTAQIVQQVEKEKKEAAVLAADCEKEEGAAMEIKRAADEVRADCQKDLDQAMPILQAAQDALNQIDDAAIREMKSFPKPPEKVGRVMEGVLILFGEKTLTWEKSKLLLGRLDFLPSLKNFAKDDIAELTIKKLQRHYVCSVECTAEEVRKTSVAAEGIYKWIVAMVKYYDATRIVAPKQAQLVVAEKKLEVAKEAQQAALNRLETVQQRVAALERQLQDNMDRKKKLEDEMKLTETRLGRAGKLMSGLSSEQTRWREGVKTLNDSQITMIGTVMIAVGFVAYLGPFTAPYRELALRKWIDECKALRVPIPDCNFDLASIADPVTIRSWCQKGLPKDEFSIQNGIITTRSKRWCLCIDPQGQANSWIRAMERENKLRIVKLSDPTYMRTLENAIKVGVPVLMENIEEQVDAALDPVLLRQTFKQQGQILLRLGDQDIEYDSNFRFYITTKLPNPHYLPELQIKVTIINFTVTRQGLEDQLLADVVRFERADLEHRADRTVVEIAEGKKELKMTEDRVLTLLATSTGNILDNQILIDTLAEAKKSSETVTANLEIAEATQKDIEIARNRYRLVALRGSLIFSVISDISGINHMYQISLDFFKRLFVQTLQRSEPNENVDVRVQCLISAVTLASYNTICRGLFEKDKQLFVFMFVGSIFMQTDEITSLEWNFFLKGTEGRKLIDPDEETWPEWTNEQSWNELAQLLMLPGFEVLKNDIWTASEEWGNWATNDKAYEFFPSSLKEASEWHKLLILKVFRPDLAPYGMTKVTGHYLGKLFMESPPFDLEAAFSDSSPTAPIIFILIPGTDPTSTFTEFAEKKEFGMKKLMLSLGQDQGSKAEEMITVASRTGSWVYLQNCHVYASWMSELDRILEELMLKEVHSEFRLWLTTMPTDTFPVFVLQSGVKLVKEPPKGLKANIRDSFHLAVTPELWESCPQNENNWKRLIFSMSYFHAIIQERRRFGPIGWNIPYEWNQSDFEASVKSLFTYLADDVGIQWAALKYMIGVINYGGRVTDFLDQRCLQTILSNFFFDDVVSLKGFNITPDHVYSIPADIRSLDTAKDYLADLPAFEQPELFGLHANADITYNRANSRKQLATILSVQPRSKAVVGVTPDEQVMELVQLFEGKLPPLIDKENSSEETYRITADGTMISLGTVCRQEVDIFNVIISKIKSTLAELKRGIRGEVVMSMKLESMYSAFLLGFVPENWHENSYLSLKPLASWFEDTLARIEFLRDWHQNGMPASFWISGFFFPQGFLTGVLQTHARAHKMPIDDITFKTHATRFANLDYVDMPPKQGVYIHGVYIEGARFDSDIRCIDESQKGELNTLMPIIWLEPVARSTHVTDEATYACPLYKTSARAGALSTTGLSTNYVLSLDLNVGKATSQHWILRGVALLCMLDE